VALFRSFFLLGAWLEERKNGDAPMEGSPASNDRGKTASAISNAIAGMHRTHYGRGPTRARTVMGSDYVICFLEEVYTPVERTLIEADRFDTVRQTRNAFQDTMRQDFSDAVERIVGRKVIGFLSQVHVGPDLAIETFILEPDSGAEPAEGEGEG
jgi:uncharacterized protein YbcI